MDIDTLNAVVEMLGRRVEGMKENTEDEDEDDEDDEDDEENEDNDEDEEEEEEVCHVKVDPVIVKMETNSSMIEDIFEKEDETSEEYETHNVGRKLLGIEEDMVDIFGEDVFAKKSPPVNEEVKIETVLDNETSGPEEEPEQHEINKEDTTKEVDTSENYSEERKKSLADKDAVAETLVRRRSDSVDGRPSAWLVPSRPAGDSHSLLG